MLMNLRVLSCYREAMEVQNEKNGNSVFVLLLTQGVKTRALTYQYHSARCVCMSFEGILNP